MGEPVSATAIRASIPANVDAAIRKALEKLPADRFTGAHGFARALGDTGFRHGAEAVAEGEGRETAGFWKPLAIAAGVLALIALAVAAREWTRPEPPGQPPLRAHFEMEGRTVAPVDHVAVSADGSMFAASFLDEGNGTLHIRNADEEVFRAVPGTENARGPTFSPQGDWIAFADNQTGSLLKVSIAGGAPRPVVTADVGAFQAFWGDDGTIVFWGDVDGVEGIYRVADTGGDPRLLLEVGPGMEPLNPRLLPGGDKLIATNGDSASTFLLDLDDGSATTLIEGGIGARYVETGHLVYADLAGGLWAVRFDPGAEAVSGEPVPVLEGVTVWFNRFPRFSVAGNGTLVYGRGGGGGATAGETRELVMIDMAGVEEVAPLTPRPFDDLFWSPDGSSIVYTSSVAEGRAVLTYNVDLGTTPQQITFDGEFNRAGPWSPDGTRVAFTSARSGTDGMDLFVKNVTDDSPPQMVFSAPGFQYPTDWPADDVLVFLNANGGSDNLWVMDPADSASARPYLEAEARLLDMRVSPGGDLAAYMSNETGFFQIYVRSFPEPRQPVLVSSGVGGRPRWSPSGDTLYYWRGGAVDTLYAASVRRQPTFAVESIEAVFTGQWEQGDTDLHPEGDRWISARAAGSGNAPGQVEPERFLVVTNWFEELRAALGEDDR
jgi:serine/threonine-protein kinase